jgi:tRNA(adenine34) deaminase
MTTWATLSHPWRVAFEEAVEALSRHDSFPIGACISDPDNNIIARAGNRTGKEALAHAELNALRGMGLASNRRMLTLHTTLEPCMMCVGAIRWSQVGHVSFAAHDPVAGAAGQFDSPGFMAGIPCKASIAQVRSMEFVSIALLVEHMTRKGQTRWSDIWMSKHPEASKAGAELARTNAREQWSYSSAGAVFEQVLAHSHHE